jgi:mannose-6-phosphate isomerase
MNWIDLSRQPLKLVANRVRRPFKGGMLLDQWQGVTEPKDDFYAEEWVASTLEARNPDPLPEEGLSRVRLPNADSITLRELIASAPENFLGAEHFKKYGADPAILVKVLDSASRLMIQVHPDRCFAREILHSGFGKTEAWAILGGREIEGEQPHVFLGFKPGITRRYWKELFERQDVPEMLDALHRFPVRPGEAYLVEGGVPHAAGSGCFFMEIQEPTDFTIRVERVSPAGSELADEQLHLGTGFERMLDCFHYEGLTAAETLRRWRLQPHPVRDEAGGRHIRLVTEEDTPFFGMDRIEVRGKMGMIGESRFSVAVVLRGTGMLHWQGGRMEVNRADELFLPASLGSVTWEAEPVSGLTLIRCLPPG